jgi:GxxExxY protein
MQARSRLNDVTGQIIAAAIEVHRHLGPGLLESSYASCLQRELAERRVGYATQQPVPLVYKGATLEPAYRVDFVVEGEVIVELKCIDRLLSIHDAQVLTYLRLTGCPVGLLINFNVPRLKDGIKRLLNPRRLSYPGADVDISM